MKNILAVTKIGTKQKRPSFRQQKINEDFHRDTLYYNEEKDQYICPMGQPMNKIGERGRKTKNGYIQTSSHYQARIPTAALCIVLVLKLKATE
ncbi:MAG: hypothetical protein ABS44_01200 [Chryseobacterium sp. SCN 40-13]|nr:MAG: hypothetical protein ABS44_01200 [Chryseobacterium sp. SCN 40-13]